MKRILLACGVGIFITSAVWGQDLATTYAEKVTEEDLRMHLEVVASDSMEGRATATAGQKRAARYIQSHFETIGLKGVAEGENPYQQEFKLEERTWGEVTLEANGNEFRNLEDFFYIGDKSMRSTDMEVVYVGKGEEADIEDLNLEDKAVIILAPGRGASNEPMERCKEKGAAAFLVIYSEDQDQFMSFINTYKVYLARPQLGFAVEEEGDGDAVFLISPEIASTILDQPFEDLQKMADKGKVHEVEPAEIELAAARDIKELVSSNVVGFLEGSDEELKDEVLVVTAHYDHLGTGDDGDVYNGADDDGSGTVTVMELAQSFAMAAAEGNGPRRSILFMLVSGEEKGLLGSEYYTENPIFPLEKTVTNLNIDMIGRVDDAHEKDPYFVYVIGSDKLSTELHDLSEAANNKYTKLDLDYRYNDENDPNRYYYRSDHYNFAKNNIPVVFYFNGTHEDYHRTSDTVDKIHFGKMERIGRLVFYTAWEVANRDSRPALDAVEESADDD
ncbi:MAG TPA: arginyl aminopeptidase [Cytophagales bacterium]|nr:arginyl aminopeptidase [Cytophagales bacterium]HAP65010.1 arginyl aminopeptidase [Cytophagales bacterium]